MKHLVLRWRPRVGVWLVAVASLVFIHLTAVQLLTRRQRERGDGQGERVEFVPSNQHVQLYSEEDFERDLGRVGGPDNY